MNNKEKGIVEGKTLSECNRRKIRNGGTLIIEYWRLIK